jgi:hypothetical protein
MPKVSLKINDDLVFSFPKNTYGSETKLIPEYVKKHFLSQYKSLQLSDENFAKKSFPLRNNSEDIESKAQYLFEIEFTFSGNKIGGMSYRPGFDEKSLIEVNLIDESLQEDEETIYLKFNINAELYWDFKSNHYKKYESFVESNNATWETAKIDIRFNFRNNFLHVNGLKYDEKGNYRVLEPESENNLLHVLESTPNIFSLVKNYLPEKEWEKNSKYWQLYSEKKIRFEGNYFKHLTA